jgi:hypothetical protein
MTKPIKLSVSPPKTLLVVLFGAFIFFLGILVIQFNPDKGIIVYFAAAFFFILSSVFTFASLYKQFSPIGTATLCEEGYFDNGLKKLIHWEDVGVHILNAAGQQFITIQIHNLEKYLSGCNPKIIKRYQKTFKHYGGHIHLQFVLLNLSLKETIETIEKLTEQSKEKVEIILTDLDSD